MTANIAVGKLSSCVRLANEDPE